MSMSLILVAGIKTFWLYILSVMSNVKVLAMQYGQKSSEPNMHNYLDQYELHMNQNITCH